MENILITAGAVAGVVLGGYTAGSMFSEGSSLIAPFLGAMFGAMTGGWVSSRMIDRLS